MGTAGASPAHGELTGDQRGDVLGQAAGEDVGQLGQEAETALPGFHALVLQLLVQGLDDAGDLQFGKQNQKHVSHASLQGTARCHQSSLLG